MNCLLSSCLVSTIKEHHQKKVDKHDAPEQERVEVKPATTIKSSIEVPFTQYENAEVITQAQFLQAGKPKNTIVRVPGNHVVFQAIQIGGSASSNVGGGMMGEIIFIPKDKSNMVFELQSGDQIELQGSTIVRSYLAQKYISFKATSIRKL